MNAAVAVADFDSFPVSMVERSPVEHTLDLIALDDVSSREMIGEGLVGRSRTLQSVFAELEMVAPTDSTVLICGETGTGKELVANAIHNLSRRRASALVKCNCAALPASLLESELFGHEKGAFTGAATTRVGRFELAHRGTIFLDEIGEAPLEIQPKLLRVLQEREFERLGSSRTVRVDIRLVAATNVNLPEMVKARQFRADLYYRLNVFPVHLPPLRERRDDIPLLVRHFVSHYASRMGRRIRSIASSTLDALVAYSWPGNIRELQNVIERSVIRSAGDLLEVDIPTTESGSGACVGGPRPGTVPHGTLEEAERAHILAALKDTRWVLAGPRGAAMRLGINRSTLQFRMKKLGIDRPAAR